MSGSSYFNPNWNSILKDGSKLAADSLLHTTSFVSIYPSLEENMRKTEMEWIFFKKFQLLATKDKSVFNYFYDV